jgi:hypothetical protein
MNKPFSRVSTHQNPKQEIKCSPLFPQSTEFVSDSLSSNGTTRKSYPTKNY